MDAERREIIVREIERWRQGRMLPDHYCDFLLRLYDSEGQWSGRRFGPISTDSVRRAGVAHWFAVVAAIATVACFVFYFTSLGLALQVVLTAGAVGTAFWAGARFRRQSFAKSCTSFAAGSLVLLAAGYAILADHGWLDAALLMLWTVLCCTVWIAIGVAARLRVFLFCGAVGLLLAYARLLTDQAEAQVWAVEAGLLAASALFFWLGGLLLKGHRESAVVLLALGLLSWLFPEPFLELAFAEPPGWAPAVFVLKLLVAGGVLFQFRNRWTKWLES